MSLDLKSDFVRIENLNVFYPKNGGWVHAVRGVSFDIETGEAMGVVGESGCGKTAAMLALMRLLPVPPVRVHADRLIFRGRDLTRMSDGEMRRLRGNRMAMVFQEPMTALNPFMTIGEQLEEVLYAHERFSKREVKARVRESLSLVGIPDVVRRAAQYPHELSGGMRQRVMIAMALMLHPDLLIADEPTTALDATIEAQILELVADLISRFGMSIVWITHNLGIVSELCRRTVVMYAGSVVEIAPTSSLFVHPRHPYTEALLGALPTFHQPKEPLKGLDGSPPDLSKPIEGCPFAARCTRAVPSCRKEAIALREVSAGRWTSCLRVQCGDF